MKDQFRLAGCSRGEINDERVSALRPLHPGYLHQVAGDRSRIIDLLDIADPPGSFASVRRRVASVGQSLLISSTLPEFSLSVITMEILAASIRWHQVLWSEHRGAGAENRSQLDTGDGKDPPFRNTGEHDDDTVPLLHPVNFRSIFAAEFERFTSSAGR